MLSETKSASGGKKILIVDDTKETRQLLRFTLTQENYEVIEASNGEEAINIASQEKPDLILLDIVMPKLDGFSTAIKLQETKETENIPIIVSTSKGRLCDLFVFHKTQVKDYIEKPFLPETLVDKIKNILSNE